MSLLTAMEPTSEKAAKAFPTLAPIVSLPDIQGDFSQQVNYLMEKQYQILEAFSSHQSKPNHLSALLQNKAVLNSDDIARQVAQKMVSHQFCKQRPADFNTFLLHIKNAVSTEQPINCIIGHGPLKNVNNCQYSSPDWAEFFTYTQLLRLATAVQAIYPPGLRVSLYVDDGRAAWANKVPSQCMDNYFKGLCTLTQKEPFNTLIKSVVSIKGLYEKFNYFSTEEQARGAVQTFLSNPENQPAIESYIQHAARNLPPEPFETTPSHQIRVQQSVFRYLQAYEMEKLCGIWSQPNTLYLRYAPHKGFYQIFTLRKGSVSQPWQGQGVLFGLPSQKVDPGILTTQKTALYQQVYEQKHALGEQFRMPVLRVYKEAS